MAPAVQCILHVSFVRCAGQTSFPQARCCSANEKTVSLAELASLPYIKGEREVRKHHTDGPRSTPSSTLFFRGENTSLGKYKKCAMQTTPMKSDDHSSLGAGRCLEVRSPGYISLRSVEAVTPAIGSRSLGGCGAANSRALASEWSLSGQSARATIGLRPASLLRLWCAT